MGRLRSFAGRLRRKLLATIGSGAADLSALAKADQDPVIIELNAMILDGDVKGFEAAWAKASNDSPSPALAEQLVVVRAEAELSLGHHAQVGDAARKLIDVYRNPLGHFYLARSLFLRAQYPESIALLQACLYAMPNHTDSAYLLSDAAVLSGDREFAWRSLEQVARKAKRPRTWLLMANLVETPGDFSRLYNNWRQARTSALTPAIDPSVAEYMALGALRCGNPALARQIWSSTLLGLAAAPEKLERARPKVVNYSSRRAEAALSDLNKVLSKAEVPMFLVSGTLLGCVREGRLLGHDKDIDVGIWDDIAPDRVKAVLRGCGLFTVLASRSPEIVRVRHTNGINVDVFYHYREASDYWHGGVKMRWHNKPFKLVPREFLGEQHLIPEDVDTYLRENYGNWKEPKIDFDSAFDTPNGEIANRDELAIHSFKMLTDALIKAEPAKVGFYLDKLKASGEAGFVKEFKTILP